jgi:hypothetical protein
MTDHTNHKELPMRIFITALAMALVLPASALAVTAEDVIRAQAPPHFSPVVPKRLPTSGTDVAAPDQQAPISPVAAAGAPPAAGRTPAEGFDWGDVAIGAGCLVLITVVGGFGVAGVHRRRSAHPVAPVS